MARTETVTTSGQARSGRRTTTPNDVARAAASGAGRLAGTAGNVARGVFNQAVGRSSPQQAAGRRAPAKGNPSGMQRTETLNPQYEAILRAQGRQPNAQGSYAGSPPPMSQGNPGAYGSSNGPGIMEDPGGPQIEFDRSGGFPGGQQPSIVGNGGINPNAIGAGSNPQTGEMQPNDPYIQWYLQNFGTLPPEYGG